MWGTRLHFLYPPTLLNFSSSHTVRRYITRNCVRPSSRWRSYLSNSRHTWVIDGTGINDLQRQQFRRISVTRHGTAVPRDLKGSDTKAGEEEQQQQQPQSQQQSPQQPPQSQQQSQQDPPAIALGVSPSKSGSDNIKKPDEAATTPQTPSVVSQFIEKSHYDDSASSTSPGSLPSSSSTSPTTLSPTEKATSAVLSDSSQSEQAPKSKTFHNFSTYDATKTMADAGLPPAQARAMTKTIRDLLIHHIGEAKDAHVTKSMSENENYLFRAACSELRTEVQNSRKAALDKTRLERAQLQHDYDQLQQSFSADLINLRDEVSSLFNDRKMVTRAEQRGMEVKIQELNYKLTVLLSGDLRSEIESLRWITTRRSLIALLVLALVIISFIRTTQGHSAPPNEHDHDDTHLDSQPKNGRALTEELVSQNMRDDHGDGSDGGLVSLG